MDALLTLLAFLFGWFGLAMVFKWLGFMEGDEELLKKDNDNRRRNSGSKK